MSSNRTLMVLPGDGVGPEVVNETLRVVEWLAKNKSITFNVKEHLCVVLDSPNQNQNCVRNTFPK